MTDGTRGLSGGTKRRIVEAIVADIAVRRASPQVYLLDGEGCPTVWPAQPSLALPGSLVPLVAMYFAQSKADRGAFSEIVDVDGQRVLVRILCHAGDTPQYALTFEPFVVRARKQTETGELSPSP